MTKPTTQTPDYYLKRAIDLGPEEIEQLFQDAARLSVVTQEGRNKWRSPGEVEATDQIIFVKGQPQVMRKSPGRGNGAFATLPVLSSAGVLEEQTDPAPEAPAMKKTRGGVHATGLIEEFREKRKSFMDNHPLMKEVRSRLAKVRDPVIRMTLEMTAKELILGEFDREELESSGRETSSIARNLMANVKTLSDMWYKHTESQRNFIDLKSPQFQAVFEHLLETFRLAMDASGVSEDQMVTIFAETTKLIEGEDWVQEANLRQSKVSMG